jgi:cell division ATPase FtsA
MGVEVIATFLPRSVVESLYAVMERSGLEVINLTLEPIAAIALAIPEKLSVC